MKKFYLGALGCLLAMGASAQKIEQVGTMQGMLWSLHSIPTEYAYNGNPSVYTINTAESGVEFIVYNKSFAVDRTIKLVDPTNYKRIEVESREMDIESFEIGTVNCGQKNLSGISWQGGMSYPHWWANYKGGNTTCTADYVPQWFEHEKTEDLEFSQDMVIESKVEYDGGTLFITNITYDAGTFSFFFKENSLSAVYYSEGNIVVTDEEWISYSYREFYNIQTVEFTQESIAEYINMGQHLNFYGDEFSFYQVDSIATEKNGEVVFYTNYYYEKDTFGKQYPVLKFVWNKGSDSLTAIYEGHIPLYIGEWQKSLKEDDNYDEKEEWLWDTEIYPFLVGEIEGEHDGGVYATQTFFNNDEKWEYLRPAYEEAIVQNYEQDRDGNGEIDYRQTRYANKLKAYEIVSEDGNVLSSIPVPEGDYYDLMAIQWDGEVYFGISVEDEIEQDGDYYYKEYAVIYSIDKIASSVKKIASTPAMRVSPALAERNSTVNVILDVETVKNGGELIITDSNGRTIGRSHVEAGQTSVPVTTDRMCSGVYNITLTEKGQKVENARIIVK